MRILVVDSYYPAFLSSFYAQRPDLIQRSYDEQWRALMDQCFGTADFYSTNLIALGHEATEIVVNCEYLQHQWAHENGIKLSTRVWTMRAGIVPWPVWVAAGDWFYKILIDQVRAYRPDVLHIQDMNAIAPEFLHEVRPHVKLITGQIACPIRPDADFSDYDLVLSSLPHYVQRFKAEGLNSRVLRLGFEESLLNKLPAKVEGLKAVHVGGYSPIHRERNEFLEHLLTRGAKLDCWGYGVDELPPASPIRACYRGEAWGLEMYNIRRSAQIVVSGHVTSVAADQANIMTMYEATGVGTLLLIDDRSDLNIMFEPGKEVVAYKAREHAVELINYYLEHPNEQQAIARAGQERTLKEHTYRHRMEEFADIVSDYL